MANMDTERLWILKVEIPWDEYKTTADYLFKSEEDALWYADNFYLQRYFMGDKECMLRSIDVESIAVLERKHFTTSNPYIAIFENGELHDICPWAEWGMLDNSLNIQEFAHMGGVQHTVRFWYAGETGEAREIAKGYLTGYLLGKAKNS